MNNKERILKAARGEMVNKIPYAPRVDLWHTANARAGTLPERHRGRSADEVARAEGWTLHKIVPEFDKPVRPEDVLHRGIGFDLIDIGVNVPVDEFVARAQKHRPDILGLSALLTTTMPQMEEVIQTLSEAGIRDSLKIMVGGAPVNEKFAIDIGADGYAVDAGEAVDVAKSLLHIN